MAEDDIALEAIVGAEALFGIEQTADERSLMAETLEAQRAWALARRKVQFDHNAPPASGFDPRLGALNDNPGSSQVALASDPIPALPQLDVDIAFAPLVWLSEWVRTQQITSLRLTSIYLERLGQFGPLLECVVTLTDQLALKQARAADAEIASGNYRGPLHGIPWGAKDLLDTAGIKTTWGAKPFENRLPDHDAEVVVRLEAAGAVLVAKLAMGALAMGDVWFGGIARNPWNPLEGASGSSAGSGAAVAAGLVGFALGTETMGSIVSPSVRNGVVGLRPTFGRVPRTGAMTLCWSLDKIGPMTRRVEDSILVLEALIGRHDGDPDSVDAALNYSGTSGIEGLRIGRDPAWFGQDGVNDLDHQVLDILRDGGASIVDIQLPDLPWRSLLTILRTEAAAAFEDLTLSGRDDELTRQDKDAWPTVFRAGRFISAVDYYGATRLRRRAMEVMAEIFSDVDALTGPSRGNPLMNITNFTGHPSLTLPTGFRQSTVRLEGHEPEDDDPKYRVPHGITLWGRLYDEGTLIRLGRELEAAFGFNGERPEISA